MKNFLKKLASIAAAIVAAFSVTMPGVVASAEEVQTTSTSVMQDLQSDATFNADDYPSKTIDELKADGEEILEVIRIAEGSMSELYLYVYNPSDETKEITATNVLMGRTENDVPSVYSLKLISTEGVFDKYRIEDFKVLGSSSKLTRNYNITSLYRSYDAELDAGELYGAEDTYMAVPVAQLWYAISIGKEVKYVCESTKVIRITEEIHETIRYSDGWHGFFEWENTDSHIVAFTTDRFECLVIL